MATSWRARTLIAHDEFAVGLDEMDALAFLVEESDAQDLGAPVAVAVVDVGNGVDDFGGRLRERGATGSGFFLSCRYWVSLATVAARVLADYALGVTNVHHAAVLQPEVRSPRDLTSETAWETKRMVMPRARSSWTLRMQRWRK